MLPSSTDMKRWGDRAVCWRGQMAVVERLACSGLAWVSEGGPTNERMLIFPTGRQTNKRSARLTQNTFWIEQTNISHGTQSVFRMYWCSTPALPKNYFFADSVNFHVMSCHVMSFSVTAYPFPWGHRVLLLEPIPALSQGEGRVLPGQVASSSQGPHWWAMWGSISCSKTLRHPAQPCPEPGFELATFWSLVDLLYWLSWAPQ